MDWVARTSDLDNTDVLKVESFVIEGVYHLAQLHYPIASELPNAVGLQKYSRLLAMSSTNEQTV